MTKPKPEREDEGDEFLDIEIADPATGERQPARMFWADAEDFERDPGVTTIYDHEFGLPRSVPAEWIVKPPKPGAWKRQETK